MCTGGGGEVRRHAQKGVWMQIGSRSDRGADRYADSAGRSQQAGLLLRSGQRWLETACLVGGWWCWMWGG